MATQKIKKLIIGQGDLQDTSVQSQITTNAVRPTPGDGNDGDIWIVVDNGGSDYDILQKVNGTWISLVGRANLENLVDGQATTATGFEFPATFKRAYVRYTITRGSGGRIKQGSYQIVNDGGGTIQYSEDFTTLGNSVNVQFQGFDFSGGNIRWRYKSTFESVPIVLQWHLEGW